METRIKGHSLDPHINSFAIRSFRDVGDNDYIVARLAHRARLTPQFLWAGLQALEKYLKCILVLNRIKAARVHSLEELLKAFNERKPFEIAMSGRTKKFIEHLDTYGAYRYLEIGTYARREELLDLDRAVWEIRRFARPMTSRIGPLDAEQSLAMEIKANLAFEDTPTKFKITGGRLEAIIANKEHSARSALVWHNAHFSSRNRETVPVEINFGFENAPLQLYPELVDHIAEYVHIPKKIADAYRRRAEEKQLPQA